MALKIAKVVHKGNEARKKNKERIRVIAPPKKRRRSENFEAKPLITFPTFTVYGDDTINRIKEKIAYPQIVSEVFSGLVIDSNYRIMFNSNEIDRYEQVLDDLFSIYLCVDGAKYKLGREVGLKTYLPLFSRVNINDREVVVVMNELFGVIVKEDKFIIVRRDKKQTRYSIRLENILKKFGSGRVEFMIPKIVRELGASNNYVKNFPQFMNKNIKEAVNIINNNDNGVYIKDFDRAEDSDMIWFEIEVADK